METDLKNLQQELLRLTLRLIALENVVSGTVSNVAAFPDIIKDIMKRLATLEEARQGQIKFNTIMAKRLDDYGIILTKPKKFWKYISYHKL